MRSKFSLQKLASRLGLACRDATDPLGSALTLKRHGFGVDIPDGVARKLSPQTPIGRHLAWGVFFGVRLAIDHRIHQFRPAEERTGEQALYGGRLPRLVNAVTLSWFEALSNTRLFTSDWLLESLKIAYLFESGKFVHALSGEEADQIPYSAEKSIKDARHALFYDSYKLKPSQKIKHPQGLIRVFKSSEGLGATRAILLPDFDYDAAREGGCFAIPSRDTMIIGRPKQRDDAANLRQKVAALSHQMLSDAPYPLCATIFDMTHDRAFPGPSPATTSVPTDDGTPRQPVGLHHLPSYNDDATAVLAPSGVHIYSSSSTDS